MALITLLPRFSLLIKDPLTKEVPQFSSNLQRKSKGHLSTIISSSSSFTCKWKRALLLRARVTTSLATSKVETSSTSTSRRLSTKRLVARQMLQIARTTQLKKVKGTVVAVSEASINVTSSLSIAKTVVDLTRPCILLIRSANTQMRKRLVVKSTNMTSTRKALRETIDSTKTSRSPARSMVTTCTANSTMEAMMTTITIHQSH